MPMRPATLSPRSSSAIAIIRPLLILFIMLAHIPGLDIAALLGSRAELNFSNWLSVFLRGVLARSGVPLLSLISGYLAVYSLEKHGYFRLLGKKAVRLLWPLCWANLLMIILIAYPAQAANPGFRPDLELAPFNLLGWFQATFAYYKLPANQPLYFLKDLYTCFLLLPLLLALARIRYVNLLVVAWMAYKCIYLKPVFGFPVFPLIFIRFDIVFAFYLGILLWTWGLSPRFARRNLSVGSACLFVLICAMAGVAYIVLDKKEYAATFLWLDFAVKVFSVLGCIGIMSILSSSRSRISALLSTLSPYAYTLFLTHVFAFTWFNMAWLRLFGRPRYFDMQGALYLAVILCFATLAAVACHRLWFRVALPLAGRFRAGQPG